ALRVVEPRVDVDTLSARRVEAEGGVPQPGQGRVSHQAPFVPVRGRDSRGTSELEAKLGRDGPPSAPGPARADRLRRRPLAPPRPRARVRARVDPGGLRAGARVL